MPGVGFAVLVVFWLLARGARGAAPQAQPQSDVPFAALVRILAGLGASTMAVIVARDGLGWARDGAPEPPRALMAVDVVLWSIAIPDLWIEGVLVPIGAARLSAWLERTLAPPSAYHERDGAGLLVAARAAARRPSTARLAYARRAIARAPQIGSRGAAAHALLLAVEGHLDDARALFQLVTDVHFREPGTARFARDWLAVDAASRGDRRAIARVARERAGRLARLLAALASLEAPAAWSARARLCVRWAFTPYRRQTWPLVRRTLAGATWTAPHEPMLSDAALEAHRRLLGRGPHEVRLRDVRAAVEAIETLSTSAELGARLATRALALGATTDVERLRSDWCRALTADVADVVAPTDLSLEHLESSPTKEQLLDAVRERRRAALEGLAADVRARTTDRRDLPAVEEWLAWSRIARALRRALRSASDAELAVLHRIVYPGVTNWAVRLCNVRGLRWLASHVFATSATLAERVHDVAAASQLRSNVRGCSAAFLPRRALPEDSTVGDERGNRIARLGSFLFLFALVPLGVATAVWLGNSPFVLVVLALLAVALLLPTRVRYVEAAVTEDGVLIQNARGAFFAEVDDVTMVPITSRATWIRLARRPRWIAGGTFLTFSRAPDVTRSALASLRARATTPGP